MKNKRMIDRLGKIRTLFIVVGVALIAFTTMVGCGGSYYQGELSDHFDGERFFNPDAPPPKERGFFTFMKLRLFEERPEWPDHVTINKIDKPPARVNGEALRVSYVGHATLLVQTRGVNILLDPIWSERASPFTIIGPKRIKRPGIAFEDLPAIDAVLVSHNHYDHLDVSTLSRLWHAKQPRMITALGNDKIIQRHDREIPVETYDWWQTTKLSQDVSLTFVPVQHWSARGLTDRNKALWTGFVIDTPDGAIYFGADLGFGDGEQFKIIREKFPNIRFAALPIGAFKPRWFMAYSHLSPDEAVEAFKLLDAKYGLAVHFDVFQIGFEAYYEAVEVLQQAKQAEGIADDRFRALEVGQVWMIP